MKIRPPQRALKFLRFFCREDFIEEVEGDLTEVFEKDNVRGPRTAKIKFMWSVIRYLRPAFLKSLKSNFAQNTTTMFRHNFIISLRNFSRNRSSFIINVLGLSTGLACALLVFLWVNDEKHLNAFNAQDAQLYEIMENHSSAAGIKTGQGTQGLLAAALASELPEVEHAVTVVPPEWFHSKGAISFGDQRLKASPQFVSKDFFKVFTCKMLQGSEDNPLPDIHSVMISEALAKKLFHTTSNVVGKTITWSHQISGDFHVTGIFEGLPSNALDPFDILFNFDNFVEARPSMRTWDNSDPDTYVILRSGTDIAEFNKKIKGFIRAKDKNSEVTLFAQLFSERYLYGNYENGVVSSGRILYVQILSIIGSFILLIACINFMNLSTARASGRMKETGIKKSVGASRWALVVQYFTESAMITFVSLLIAVGMVIALLPQFNLITGKNLALRPDTTLFVPLVLTFIVTSFLAGSYPALYLSGFSPASVLKGKLSTTFSELLTRKGLVVFQFSLSIIMILVVWVVYQQMQFIQNRNLGYTTDNIVIFGMEGAPPEKLESFRAELSNIPGVISSGSFYHNLTGTHGGIELDWEGKTPNQHMDFANIEVGYGFIQTMGIQMKEGRNFSEPPKPANLLGEESREIILNEEAIRTMGMKDPVGKTIRFWGFEKTIVGVAKDFNFESLHEPVKPCFFRVYPVMFDWMVKVQGGTERRTLEQIEAVHEKYAAGYPFDYKFLDENYQALYVSEHRVSNVAAYFAGVAILISCLGLFALAAFTAEKRLKEIGIRKVLGSSVTEIVFLLSSDFTKIVLVSITIALPVGYFMVRYWLDSFAFKTELSWYYFFGAGLGAMMIAWITIGAHTLKAARVNPVNCLKAE